MNATVSLLPATPHAAPRPTAHGATAGDTGVDADGTGSALEGGPATGGARPFSTWMREQQQQQQQVQERRRLAGSGAPGTVTPGTGATRGNKAPGVAGDADAAGSTKPTDLSSAQGVSMALVDPIVCEAPAGGLAALLAMAPTAENAASSSTDDAFGSNVGRDRFPLPGTVQGHGDRAAGRADGLAGDAGRRAAGGADAASAAPRGTGDGALADVLSSSDGAHGGADVRGERSPGDVGRAGSSRGAPATPRSDNATTFAASLDAAEGRRGASVGSTSATPSAATPAASGTAAAFAMPTEPARTDPFVPGAPVLDLATPVDAADFAPALGAQVAVLARDGVQRAELNLHPADMGPVSIDISIVGTTAHVDFGADVAATRAAIESGLADLAAALHEAGFTLAGGGVSARARERDGGDAERQAADGGRSVTAGGRRHGPAVAEGDDGTRVTRRTVQLRQGAVDLYA